MPFIIGLMNVAVPLQIGARDVAFPVMNSISLWLTIAAVVLMNISLGIGEFAKTGWVAYPPLSELQYSSGVGVDYYIWMLELAGAGSLMTGINFLVTIVKLRAPGMTLMKMPLFCWAALCTSVLIIGAFPILSVDLGLLALDRYLGMHFFTNTNGGNMMLYVNWFWAWGHPEVYILILPIFGIFSEVVPSFSNKALFGYRAMVFSIVAITIISYLVWVHHFFVMGAGPMVNSAFGIMTMIIAIPTGIKIFNWLFTMYLGRLQFATPMLWTLGFIITFAIGGSAGVMLAIPPADFVLHNSEFLIAHFHNVIIGGTVFGAIAGYIYWFPKIFGYKLNERLGKIAFWFFLAGFVITFAPLYVLGFMGMTRRLNHYDVPAWRIPMLIAVIGVIFIAAGLVFLILQLLISFIQRKQNRDLTGDPWNARTLEWSLPSPVPFYNFPKIPTVTDRDEFWERKQKGIAHQKIAYYRDILMPNNSAVGFFIGIFSIFFGFGMTWHIWWMALLGFFGIIVTLITRSFDDNTYHYIPAAEVKKTEEEHHRQLANAGVIK
jgi:cytochrome o ubiquinol oxidase subunit 1